MWLHTSKTCGLNRQVTKLNNKLRKTYGVSRSEANGMAMLIFISIAMLISTVTLRYMTFSNHPIERVEQEKLDSLVAVIQHEQQPIQISDSQFINDSIVIDPNECTLEELIAIGINGRLAHRLIKYRGKGGRFKNKSDIRKIYGLNDSIYNLVESKIEIKAPKRVHVPKNSISNGSFTRFDINKADTSLLIKIPGVGNKLASRIVKFRNSLGGYYSVTQLNDVYGLKGYALLKLLKAAFVSESCQVKMLNINILSESELRSHPYIDYHLAKNIIGYRSKHGTIEHVVDLLKDGIISDDKYQMLRPYLTCAQ